MRAYNENNDLLFGLESKEGEKIESFFDKCATVFKDEEVARMEIFKRRDIKAQLELELETKRERFQPKPYYRNKERF